VFTTSAAESCRTGKRYECRQSHAVEFDGSKLNSGVYYYTLEAEVFNLTKKMVLTK
jgi:hypothetical protein